MQEAGVWCHHGLGLAQGGGQLPEAEARQGLDARGLRQPGAQVLFLGAQGPAQVVGGPEALGQGEPVAQGPALDGTPAGGPGHQHHPGARTLVPDRSGVRQGDILQHRTEAPQARHASALPKGFRQTQGLVVAGLVAEGPRVGLQVPGELLGDPVAPALGEGRQPRDQGGLEDAVEVQAQLRVPDQARYSVEFSPRGQGIGQALAPHQHRLQPG